MSEESREVQNASAEKPVSERSLLGLIASDANAVAVATVATAASTAAGLAVKNMMDKRGKGGDSKTGSGNGDGAAPA